MGVFRRTRQQPPPLREAEAYARLHGERTGEIVRVVATPRAEPPAREMTGESLRLAFERRLARRDG